MRRQFCLSFELISIIFLVALASGDDFSIPNAWRVKTILGSSVVIQLSVIKQKPTNSVPRDEIENMSRDVVDTLVPLFMSDGEAIGACVIYVSGGKHVHGVQA